MIITQTPLRISFAGGGTDFRDFYRNHGGMVLCTAIDKYLYVVLKQRFDDKIRVGYSTTEMVDHVNQLRHELVRESMRLVGIDHGIEISTLADIPSTGSGLGSSSSVTVGLLNALYAYRGDVQMAETLAREAARIEIDVLNKPIGRQDQYVAACGNLCKIVFSPDDTVDVKSIKVDPQIKRALNERLMLFYTGIGRESSNVLSEQKSKIADNSDVLSQMVALVDDMEASLLKGDLDEFGRYLHYGWELKKSLASKISNNAIDSLYQRAVKAGAQGGKIAGAGGGGFLLLYCRPEKQDSVRKALSDLRELPFHFNVDGSKIIFNIRK
jgi:D-glycero-alpha-D-manno-heptose-7-phosphate kinase